MADGLAHVGIGTTGVSTSNYTGVIQDVVIRQCLIERGAYISPDPGAWQGLPDNRSHLDAMAQIRGGKNFLFEGNAVYCFAENDGVTGYAHIAGVEFPSGTHVTGYGAVGETGVIVPGLKYGLSAIMFSPPYGAYDNVVIRNNWMDGSLFLFNIPATATVTGLGVQIVNNNFGRMHGRTGGILIVPQATTGITMTGNKYYYSLDTSGTDDEPNPIPDLAGSGWKRHMYTGDRNLWPDANVRTRG
jgi:hypothetical protein